VFAAELRRLRVAAELTQEQVAALGDEKHITHNGQALREVVGWLYTSDYFNRLSSNRYVEACAGLPVSKMVHNCLWQDGFDELTKEIAVELFPKGYTREELLAASHTLTAIK